MKRIKYFLTLALNEALSEFLKLIKPKRKGIYGRMHTYFSMRKYRKLLNEVVKETVDERRVKYAQHLEIQKQLKENTLRSSK